MRENMLVQLLREYGASRLKQEKLHLQILRLLGTSVADAISLYNRGGEGEFDINAYEIELLPSIGRIHYIRVILTGLTFRNTGVQVPVETLSSNNKVESLVTAHLSQRLNLGRSRYKVYADTHPTFFIHSILRGHAS